MSTTILNNNGLQSLGWQQVTQNNMVNRVSKELQEGTKKIEEKYETKNAYLDAQTSQYATLKAGINNAEVAIENGEEGVKKIKDMLLEMRILVGNYATSESKEKLRNDFDELVDKINRTADLYSEKFNPIGNTKPTDWTPNTISYVHDLANNRRDMTGTYIGSDFYIEANDGTMWVNDSGASSIQQYELYNTENPSNSTKGDGFASTRSGLRLDSYNESTGEVTITVDPNNSPKTVTGTLHKGGSGLMQSWFYDLDTEEGRQKALEAIGSTDALVVGAESNLAGMKATVANDMAKVDKQVEALSEKRSEAMTAQMTEAYELQVKKQQEVQILQQTFQQMSQQQGLYSSLFRSVETNPLLDIIS